MNPNPDVKRRNLHDALVDAGGWVSIEELMSISGYDRNSLDEFFKELDAEMDAGKIRPLRAGSVDAKFIAVENFK